MQKISSYLIVISILFFSVEGFSQATTNSPYSRFGFGDILSESFSQNFALGGTGIGLRSNNSINAINPASYSEIAITSFEISATNNALWLSDGKQSQYNSNQRINYLAFGLPIIMNKWGMAFGAMPYSNVGYNYSTITKSDALADSLNNISYNYNGEGGLTKLFFGNAFKFKIDSTSMISVGNNVAFLFGNITHNKRVIYGDIIYVYPVQVLKNNHVADFNTDFGIQYQKTFTNANSEKYYLTIGATYALAADLKTKKNQVIRTYDGFGYPVDTISNEENILDVTQIPAKIA